MRKKIGAALLGLAAAIPLAIAGSAQGHGYISSPPSRAEFCAQGVVTNCGDIQFEPQSVEGPKGFPGAGPSDGTICAGGNSRFAQLDDPRGGNWPTTTLQSGSGVDFNWHLTAAHSTTAFRYFITKNGWSPTRAVTRSDLQAQPFLTVSYNGQQPPTTFTHHGTVPSGLTGRHLIVAVWDIADTTNAFYQCEDVTL
jgi:predicted carbohydrate-binding protein with CBM5 and CBM33 domain